MGLIFKKGVVYGGVTDWGMVNNRPDYGTGLSHEDYTSTEKTKLGALPTATELDTALDGKVDTVTGKQLSTEDYTTAEKTKLTALPDAATLNADLASKADDSVVVKSVNTKTPTNGAVEINAGDIPADGIGDKSVSGNPITIEDGMASVAKELSVTLEPIQDLHGYESPWIGTDTDKAPYLFRAVSDSSVQDKGTHEMDKLVGGTVAWNQAVPATASSVTGITNNGDGSFTVASGTSVYFILGYTDIIDGHVYLASGEGGERGTCYLRLDDNNGTPWVMAYGDALYKASSTTAKAMSTLWIRAFNPTQNCKIIPQLFDLTQMFGSTIADYIYSLEQSTAGAGVSWFRKLFPAPYYAYDSGSLISVKTSAHITRGFNQWDEEWEVSGTFIRSKNYIPVFPNTTYYFKAPYNPGNGLYFYTKDKTLTGSTWWNKGLFTTPSDAYYINFSMASAYGTSYNHDICINISKPTGTPKNGDYVAYNAHTYPLDSDLELRGIPKLVNNALVYDGDVYEASGAVARKYGVVDLGTLNWYANTPDAQGLYRYDSTEAIDCGNINNGVCSKIPYVAVHTAGRSEVAVHSTTKNVIVWTPTQYSTADFKTAMSGVYLVYELATPTTETADPYTSTQVIDPDGTEEYVDSRTVPIPVGHESNYANICPIEGRTGTEVQRTGKNLLPLSMGNLKLYNTSGTWNGNAYTHNGVTFAVQTDGDGNITGILANGTASGGNALLLLFRNDATLLSKIKGKTITFNGCPSGGSLNTYLSQLWFDTAGSIFDVGGGGSMLIPNDSSSPYNASVAVISGTTVTNVLYKPMIRYAYIQDATFEPYHAPDTASVTFGQTVYGGQVDFKTGKVRVTHGIVDLGTLDWFISGSIFIPNSPSDAFSVRTLDVNNLPFKCSAYQGDVAANTNERITMNSMTTGVSAVIRVKDIRFSDATSFAYFVSGVQLCYELATPIELTLTPAQLSLLEGTNILTADGTINLTYLGSMASNVQDEIDEFESGLNNVIGSIAFIENSTAKTSHAVGDYVILNGIFCKVIASISAGETLSFGTNIRATTIGAELRAIWAEISA